MGDQEELRRQYAELLERGQCNPERIDDILQEIRKLILVRGLPEETPEETEGKGKCTLRGWIWKVLLRVAFLDADKYISLLENVTKHAVNDSKSRFRAFTHDPEFLRRVDYGAVYRILHATQNLLGSYPDPFRKIAMIQGIEVVCCGFLYVMPELDAFHCFVNLVTYHCPLYYYSDLQLSVSLPGISSGIKLFNKCLEILDPELHKFLSQWDPGSYAFKGVVSLSGCTPPLREVIRLWDIFFSFGCHLNVVAMAAQMVLAREDILATRPEVMHMMLKEFPKIESDAILSLTFHLLSRLPDELFNLLLRHPFDYTLSPNHINELCSRTSKSVSSTEHSFRTLRIEN